MTGPFVRTLPPPANWQDFERLTFDLYRRIWETNDAELHGRIGQPQAGVDIYGTARIENKFNGVQCKGKDLGYGRALTLDELEAEVEKAKAFRPKLDVFVLATTAPNDVTLQQAARDITNTHREQSLFEVRVVGWTTLAQRITDYRELIQKYYPDLAPFDVAKRIGDAIDVVRVEGVVTRTVIENGNATLLAAIEKKFDPDDPLQVRISDIAKLVEDGNPAAGMKLLEKLWRDESQKASPRNRYRIRANIGVARLVMGEIDAAIVDMRAAYAEDPTWPGARAILATAEVHSGNRERALELAKVVLNEDPTVAQAAIVVADCAPESLSLAKIEAMLPEALREQPNILLTLAQRARVREDATSQNAYLARVAVRFPDDWRVLAAQGELLLDPVFAIPGLSVTRAVPAALTANLNTAIDLLLRAWDELRKRDNARIGAYVGANLLSALDVAGRDAEYDRVLDEAMKVAPAFEPILRKYAQRMIESDDWEAARKAIDAIPPAALQTPDRLLRAQVELHVGQPERAVEMASAIEQEHGANKLAEYAAAIQVEAVFKAGRDGELLTPILARWPKSMVLRSLAHNFMNEHDPRRSALLAEIRTLATEIDDPADRMHAADALYAAKQFSAAADMYADLHAPDKDTLALSRGLRSLLFAERRKEARELFEKLAEPIRHLAQYADIGVSIYEHSGLLSEAKTLIEDTLSRHDDLPRRLHWMSISERLNELQGVRKWLADVAEDVDGAPRDRMHLALAEDRIMDSAKAIAIGYRALRDGYSDPQIHLGYMIGLVFSGKAYRHAFTSPSVVKPDTAVEIEEKDGPRKLVRIIETLVNPNIERDEIPPTDELAKQLLGRKVGDEIEVPSLGVGPTIYVVREIRDKYVQAHFRSLQNFEIMFPGHPAFGSFQIDESKGDEKFKPLFDSIKKRGEHGQMLIDLYRNGRTPLMLLSRFSWHSPCDTWEWVMSQPNLPLQSCVGSPQLNAACKLLATDSTAVVDPITLYGITRLGVAEKGRACFADLGIVQTTIDMLRRLVHERGEHVGSEHGSLGWDGEHFQMVHASEDLTTHRVATARNALDFALSLTLVPSEPDTGVKADVLPLFEDCDPAFLDTIYAAQGGARLLFCDDMLFRAVAEEIAGVRGVWTQPAALVAVQKGRIAPDDYHEIASSVAGADYRFTTVNSQVVLYQLMKDKWRISPNLRAIADQIAVPTNDLDSITRLLAELMTSSWNVAPDNLSIQQVFATIFQAFRRAQPDHNLLQIARSVLETLDAKFLHNGNVTLYRRRLMASTCHTPASDIAAGVNRARQRLEGKVVEVLNGAILLAEQEGDI